MRKYEQKTYMQKNSSIAGPCCYVIPTIANAGDIDS